MQTIERLTAMFRERGLRVTAQREVIFGLLEHNDAHPTVETLYEQARTEMPTISLKTVYQTVHDLESLGEVRLLDLGTGSVRVDPNVDHAHHHLVCTVCGRVRDISLEVGGLRVASRYRRGFTIDDVQVIFRGRCEQCSPAPR